MNASTLSCHSFTAGCPPDIWFGSRSAVLTSRSEPNRPESSNYCPWYRSAHTFMSTMPFPEPPTRATLQDARNELAKQTAAVEVVSAKIKAAEDELDRLVRESRSAIQEMEKERAALADQVAQTMAYLSEIRRLPQELLGQIFMFIFEEYPCCAWVLASVCSLWRRQVLSMPRLWSKVCQSNPLSCMIGDVYTKAASYAIVRSCSP